MDSSSTVYTTDYDIDTETGAVLIPLGGKKYTGLFAKVDPCDLNIISDYSWRATSTNSRAPELLYATAYVRGSGRPARYVYMHRLILGLTGRSRQGDHINRDGLDNRRCNLRVVTPQENQFNRPPQRGSTSQYKGVSWRKADKKWSAQIWHDGRMYPLGAFVDEVEAALAYDDAVRELFGPIGYLNFPEQHP